MLIGKLHKACDLAIFENGTPCASAGRWSKIPQRSFETLMSNLMSSCVRVMTCAVLLMTSGCSQQGGSPQADPVSPLGRTAVCEGCSKEIAAVSDDNLLDVQGIQYTVCSSQCAEQVTDDILNDRHEAHEH